MAHSDGYFKPCAEIFPDAMSAPPDRGLAGRKRDDLTSNRHRALAYCLNIISAQTPLRLLAEGKTGHHFFRIML
jgi:hypothetical protein